MICPACKKQITQITSFEHAFLNMKGYCSETCYSTSAEYKHNTKVIQKLQASLTSSQKKAFQEILKMGGYFHRLI